MVDADIKALAESKIMGNGFDQKFLPIDNEILLYR